MSSCKSEITCLTEQKHTHKVPSNNSSPLHSVKFLLESKRSSELRNLTVTMSDTPELNILFAIRWSQTPWNGVNLKIIRECGRYMMCSGG